MTDPHSVETHYARAGLAGIIDKALLEAGADVDHPDLEALAAVDHFHTRGLDATRELFQRAGFAAGDHVLDIGSGLGGPARYLAHSHGCKVTGLDLTPAYCEIAERLTTRAGLSEQVRFHQGNALEMPFADAVFDGAYTQHVNMNIADKPLLIREIRRVLKSGGRFVMHEILAGNSQPLMFPLPWARTPDISFLTREDELRELLTGNGFSIEQWEDQTAQAAKFFIAMLAHIDSEGPPPVGLHLLMGADIKDMLANYLYNLEQGRLKVLQMAMRG
jgi:SAM-dependent methyltransferase